MSQEGAQAIFGAAIIDSSFCRTLLDSPAKAIEGFDLTPEEAEVLSSIRANNLERFAIKFERWRLSQAPGKGRPLYETAGGMVSRERLAG